MEGNPTWKDLRRAESRAKEAGFIWGVALTVLAYNLPWFLKLLTS